MLKFRPEPGPLRVFTYNKYKRVDTIKDMIYFAEKQDNSSFLRACNVLQALNLECRNLHQKRQMIDKYLSNK